MTQPQEIFNPVVARLRAFSWPNKNVGGPIKSFPETDDELLHYVSEWENMERKGKNARQYCRFQGELQRRYLKQIATVIPDWGAWGACTCILDTETQNVETGQAMRFGIAQMRGFAYHELIEFIEREGRPPNRAELDTLREIYILHDPDMIEMDATLRDASIALLEAVRNSRETATGVPHHLITRDQFVENVLFRNERIKGAIPLPVLLIGHKLDFDLERLPVFDAGMAKGDFFYGGFSLTVGRSVFNGGKNKGKPSGPVVQLKKIGPGKNNYRAVSRFNAHLHTHQFVDTLMLAKALLGADTPGGMDALCELFKGPLPKEVVEHFKPLTRDYVEYGLNDVERTWFIYTQLRELYRQHDRSTPIWSLYSVASVGKAYYKDFGIETFLDKNMKGSVASRLKTLKLCGVSMEAMIGARAECGIRHQIREVINKDFKSQYPTINIKLGLQDLLLAERVEINEDECTTSGDWLNGGKDAAFLERVSILDDDDGDGESASSYIFGDCALLGKDKARSDKIWRRLLGFALIDPAGAILPLRTAFQDAFDKDDGKASINVGLTEIEHGPAIWVTYLDVLQSKFLTGKMPRLLKTMRMVPVGRQPNLQKINFFGEPAYEIDLTQPDVDIFKRILEMRDEIKVKMSDLAKGSQEYNLLNAMQLALKLIANSTSYGVFVQFDVDEREKPTKISVLHGTDEKKIVARKKVQNDDGSWEASSIKVEKPGSWFAPWGPLITAGGRMLIAIAETLARHEGRTYGGIPYGMCDTDSMAFARPFSMPRHEFRAAVEHVGNTFQRINPYAAVNGKEAEVFATEDVNFAFTNWRGKFRIVKPRQMKPLYILSVSAKRYAMANIVRPDGSDYDSLADLHADWRNAVVILRKVSAHGLGPITASGYVRPPDDGLHLAVPNKYGDDDELVLKDGKPIPLYGEVCHGKGNARLFLDMWKRAFELFVQHEGLKTGREIARLIESEMKDWPGLDQPQFKQRSLNTWSQFKQYGNLRNRRAGMFFNVLPAPVDANFGMVGQSFDIDQYFGKSLYCQGGSDINIAELLAKGEVWWQSDNAPALNFVGEDKPYRLQTVAEAIGDYFNRPEFKSKGEYGALERHRVAVFQREYVGKETNFLLDPDLPDDDETQIEDAAAAPYFRYGFNPVLRAQYFSMPGIAETLAVASVDAFNDILRGYAPSVHTMRVLAHLRKGTRYNELTGTCVFDGFIREVDMADRQAARLVDLARRSFKKMNAICKVHNATAKTADYDGPPQFTRYHMNRRPIVELAAQFDLICENDRHKEFEKNCAHELINPLLYPDKAAKFLKQGSVKAQSGRELSADEAFAMFENYLGIAQRKEQIAGNVRALSASQAERRKVRRLQSRKMLMQAVSRIQMATLDDCVRMMKKMFIEDYGFDPADVEKNSPTIERITLCLPLILPDFQMLFRRHTQTRRARPNVKRFIQDLLDRVVTDHADRVRALTRVRVRRSRLKQLAEPEDRRVQVDLRARNSIKKFNA
jgi:DNA polymerase elongation subunit (family B)